MVILGIPANLSLITNLRYIDQNLLIIMCQFDISVKIKIEI